MFEELKARFLTDSVEVAREIMEEIYMVPPVLWGRDHFQTLLYIEDVCVNEGGNIEATDHRKMRVDGATYPTRIAGGETVEEHDDWDCLNDFILADCVEQREDGTLRMTDRGRSIVAHCRDEKANGTNWQDVRVMPLLNIRTGRATDPVPVTGARAEMVILDDPHGDSGELTPDQVDIAEKRGWETERHGWEGGADAVE